MRLKRDTVLKRVALELRRLSDLVEALVLEDDDESKEPDSDWKRGDYVEVMVAGDHRGKRGKLISPRGTMFWNLVIEDGADGTKRIIYKKTSNLRWIGRGED